MIRVEHISKTFQVNNGQVDAVKDMSFSIEKGEIFGIRLLVCDGILCYGESGLQSVVTI